MDFLAPLDRVLDTKDGNVLQLRKGLSKTVKHSRNVGNLWELKVFIFYCLANLDDGGRTWQSSPTLTPVGGFENRVSTKYTSLVYFPDF
jgi:transcriptional regulator of acetoin/glycerol metabolism